ncbi:hypothetical protein M728_000325 [Ensifer sp. WSM1721]|uniref:hypothetical protein n=1 Tax=Ensifer sp. WSM1721 TaxID=1041159 RepID=UPI00047944BD|nr:hypothetical protein [Ensifer sp. WSM1721]
MDMMAMALLFDMASRNRRWDEQFEPRRPARTKTFAKRLLAAFFSKRHAGEKAGDHTGTWNASCVAAAND